MKIAIDIPPGAQGIMELLQRNAYAAYVVGGCVRDSLMGKQPKDWDICTSAKPEELIALCEANNIKTIPTGIKHGTVSVCYMDDIYEVTTFRLDGEYSDNRHPDSVTFTGRLVDDLSRRDFTINAMAYNHGAGLIDPFDGRKDLTIRRLSCVGDPYDRFSEDALRILRALRFMSIFHMHPEFNVSAAIYDLKANLRNVSQERIRDELCKLVCGINGFDVMIVYAGVMETIIPELKPCIRFDQRNPYHQYTVYEHLIRSVMAYPGDDISVKMALLLHDIGKPQCFQEVDGIGRFHGHPSLSADMAETITRRLRFDNDTVSTVQQLVRFHDVRIEPQPHVIRHWMNKIGVSNLQKLLAVQEADTKAQRWRNNGNDKLILVKQAQAVLDSVLLDAPCYTIGHLKINGHDVMGLGVKQGKMVGDVLKYVLNKVIEAEIPNERNAEIETAKAYLNERKEQ